MPVRLLRILSTTLLGFAIAQAGFGSGFVGGNGDLLIIHFINAFLTIGLVVANVVAAVLYRRAGGPSWPVIFTVVLLAIGVMQVVLGENEAVGAHVFLGVLYLCALTTYCSYIWRHRPAATFSATA